MYLARWLTAAALVSLLAAPLPGCRKPVRLPWDAGPVLAGSGGTSGTGGMGGTGGVAGITDTNRPPPDAVDQPPDSGRDGFIPDTAEPCGVPSGKCCPGNRCGGGCCYLGTCVPVGDECPERSELSCFGSSCGGDCGGLKQKCCGASGYCTAPLTACTRTDASATCETCGNTGDPCCADSYCEPPNRRCVNNRCVMM